MVKSGPNLDIFKKSLVFNSDFNRPVNWIC